MSHHVVTSARVPTIGPARHPPRRRQRPVEGRQGHLLRRRPSAFATLNDLFKEFFPTSPPVRSTPVVALPRGLRFSIDAIAVAD